MKENFRAHRNKVRGSDSYVTVPGDKVPVMKEAGVWDSPVNVSISISPRTKEIWTRVAKRLGVTADRGARKGLGSISGLMGMLVSEERSFSWQDVHHAFISEWEE